MFKTYTAQYKQRTTVNTTVGTYICKFSKFNTFYIGLPYWLKQNIAR